MPTAEVKLLSWSRFVCTDLSVVKTLFHRVTTKFIIWWTVNRHRYRQSKRRIKLYTTPLHGWSTTTRGVKYSLADGATDCCDTWSVSTAAVLPPMSGTTEVTNGSTTLVDSAAHHCSPTHISKNVFGWSSRSIHHHLLSPNFVMPKHTQTHNSKFIWYAAARSLGNKG